MSQINKKNVTLFFSFLVLILTLFFLMYKTNEYKEEKKQIERLISQMSDSLRVYKDIDSIYRYERATIYGDLENIKKLYTIMSENQKELIDRIEKENKKNKVIAAALNKISVNIDSLKNNKHVFKTDSSICFSQNNDTLSYQICVNNIKTSDSTYLNISNINIKTKQFITFNWQNTGDKLKPISFNVKYDNPLFKSYEIDSYIIPTSSSEDITPFVLTKIDKIKKNIHYGIGIGVGVNSKGELQPNLNMSLYYKLGDVF